MFPVVIAGDCGSGRVLDQVVTLRVDRAVKIRRRSVIGVVGNDRIADTECSARIPVYAAPIAGRRITDDRRVGQGQGNPRVAFVDSAAV